MFVNIFRSQLRSLGQKSQLRRMQDLNVNVDMHDVYTTMKGKKKKKNKEKPTANQLKYKYFL